MRAIMIVIGLVVVLGLAAFIALLVVAATIEPEQGEVRIELEDTFPD